jgi:hypothetical protein
MSARIFATLMQTVNQMNARRTSLHVSENVYQSNADCQPNERSPNQSACQREYFRGSCRLVRRPFPRIFATLMQTVNQMKAWRTSLYVGENILTDMQTGTPTVHLVDSLHEPNVLMELHWLKYKLTCRLDLFSSLSYNTVYLQREPILYTRD